MEGFGLTNPLLDAIKAAIPKQNPALTTPTPPILTPGTANPQFSAIKAQTIKQPEQAPPPLIPPMNAPSVAPIGPSKQPEVTTPPVTHPTGTLAGDRAYRQYLESSGSGVHQIKNPFLHGLARTGDVIGGLLSQRLMQAIPGTEEHHNLLLGRANQALTQDEANAEKEAQTGNLQSEIATRPSEVALRGAQMHEAEARANALENPQAKEKEEQWSITPEYTGPNGEPVEVEKNSGQMRIAGQGGPAFKRVEKTAPPGTKTVQLEVAGKPHQVLVDERTGETVRDLGESGEKPPVVRVETPSEKRGEKNDLLKAYQPTLDSAERLNVMTESYEKAVKNHDQQAMLNLLANHLGMTMGLQKGARMTKEIIREAQQSQPWLQGLEAKFDKDGYLSGVTLSPMQMRQMVDLGQSRYAEDAKKSRATAQYLGAKDDGPDRIPGKATMRFYLGQTGGDVNKAKQLATDDGWTVK